MSFVLFVLSGAGCEYEERVISSTWDQLPADRRPNRDADRNGRPAEFDRITSSRNNSNIPNYAIELKQYAGNGARTRANEDQRVLLQRYPTLPFWVGQSTEAGGNSNDNGKVNRASQEQATLYVGRFERFDDTEALFMIADARALLLNGRQPFRQAEIVSTQTADLNLDDPLDARSQQGKYALQIGFFDGEHRQATGQTRYEAAEAFAQNYRDQGLPAFYYHGPFTSLILLNPLTEEDAFIYLTDPVNPKQKTQRYSEKVLAMQVQFPNMISNGVAVSEGSDIPPLPTVIVRIP